MPIQYNNDNLAAYRENAGQVDGDEWIYQLNPANTYIVGVENTAAGTATLRGTNMQNQPNGFTGMAAAFEGTQSGNFSREVRGWSYVGLDVASGTWTVRVRRV